MIDPKSPIRGVQDTALLVAQYRAAETASAAPLIKDPLAARLVGERGPEIVRHLRAPPASAWSVVIRTRVIDDLLREALAGGVDTVLNLGAGLDTRPYRLDLPPGLRWIEADFPDMIAFKEERLAGETPRCQLSRFGLDLADPTQRDRLLEQVDALGGNVLVITEGVVPYLTDGEAGALGDALRARRHFGGWIVDYFSPRVMRYRHRRGLGRRMKNAPFRFNPPDWHAFFAAHGWREKEMRYLPLEGARLGRPVPLSWWMRLVIGLAPKHRRVDAGKMLGYALLVPR